MPYWYNVTTGRVEDDATRSRDDEVMGPYASKDEAANALAHARENTERWDAEDRRWNDGDTED
jgi:hypothetical protein